MIVNFSGKTLLRFAVGMMFSFLLVGIAPNDINGGEGKSTAYSKFIGVWEGTNSWGNPVCFDIRPTSQRPVVHFWLTDSMKRDLGEFPGTSSDGNLTGSQDDGFCERYYQFMNPENTQLNVTLMNATKKTIYTDNSGREDYTDEYTLKKVGSTPKLTGEISSSKKYNKVKKTITGRILDPEGHPAPLSTIFIEWRYWNGNKPTGNSSAGTTTDQNGDFSFPLYFQDDQPITLMAINADFSQGAIFTCHPFMDKKQEIKLDPTVTVTGKISVDIDHSSYSEGGWPSLEFIAEPQKSPIAYYYGNYGGTFILCLPIGTYTFQTEGPYQSGAIPVRKILTLEKNRKVHDMGTIQINLH